MSKHVLTAGLADVVNAFNYEIKYELQLITAFANGGTSKGGPYGQMEEASFSAIEKIHSILEESEFDGATDLKLTPMTMGHQGSPLIGVYATATAYKIISEPPF